MVTLFTIPKPFQGEFEIIQKNALRSWRALSQDIQIILLGEPDNLTNIAEEIGADVESNVLTNRYGTPLLSSAFSIVRHRARFARLAYVNADIVFTGGLLEAISNISFSTFLMVGERKNLSMSREIVFEKGWQNEVESLSTLPRKSLLKIAIDFFVFNHELFRTIPDFAVGRCFWDHWLIGEALRKNIPVVDASVCVKAYHQDHTYAHVPGGKRAVWTGVERDLNLAMAGGGSQLSTLRASTHRMNHDGVVFKKRAAEIIQLLKRRAPKEPYNAYFRGKVFLGKLFSHWRVDIA